MTGGALYVGPLVVIGSNLFAGTNGVYRSTDSGASWVAMGLMTLGISSLAVAGTNLFAGTYNIDLYRSTDSGASWIPVNSGLPENRLRVNALSVCGTTLFIEIDNDSVYRSTDNGASWSLANAGLPGNPNTDDYGIVPFCFAASGTNIFGGIYNMDSGGVFLSTDNGTSWKPANTGLKNESILSLAVNNTTLFAGTGGSYFRTSGGVWKRPLSEIVSSVRPTASDFQSTQLTQIYPNPATTDLNIITANPSRPIHLIDMLGRELLSGMLSTSGQVTLDVSKIPRGVYSVMLDRSGVLVSVGKVSVIVK